MIFVIRQDLVVTLMCYCHFAITHVTQYRLICLIFMLTNTLIILAKADIRESQISIKLLNSVFWYFEGSHLRRVHPHLFSDMTTTIIVWRINRWWETLFFWIGLSYLLTYWLSLLKGGFITVRGTQFLVFKKLLPSSGVSPSSRRRFLFNLRRWCPSWGFSFVVKRKWERSRGDLDIKANFLVD